MEILRRKMGKKYLKLNFAPLRDGETVTFRNSDGNSYILLISQQLDIGVF